VSHGWRVSRCWPLVPLLSSAAGQTLCRSATTPGEMPNPTRESRAGGGLALGSSPTRASHGSVADALILLRRGVAMMHDLRGRGAHELCREGQGIHVLPFCEESKNGLILPTVGQAVLKSGRSPPLKNNAGPPHCIPPPLPPPCNIKYPSTSSRCLP